MLPIVASLAVGVGNIPRRYAPARLLRLICEGGIDEFCASHVVGVGNNTLRDPGLVRSSISFPFCIATEVCNKPGSVSLMRCVDTASWKYIRLYFVAFNFQISTHLLEYQSLRPINNSENILAHDPAGTYLMYCSKHLRPEISVIFRPFSLACNAEWLARETSGEDIDASSPRNKVCISDINILYGIGVMVVKYRTAEWINLTIE
jgi:hypothetical protein